MKSETVSLSKTLLYLLMTILVVIAGWILISPHLYFLSDNSPSTISMTKPSEQSSSNDRGLTAVDKLASVESLIDGLRAKLDAQPNDMNRWVLLAKSYHHLQRWKEATNAFQKAKSLGYQGQSTLINNVSPQPAKFSPIPENSLLQDYLNQQKVDKDQPLNNVIANKPLTLNLSLSPALFDTLDPNLTVFVFARSFNNKGLATGPPLAAMRIKVRDLPADLSLNDDMAMISGNNISSAEHIVVGARVSLSGNPIKQLGDYEQLSSPISSKHQDILTLVISEKNHKSSLE